MTTPIGADSPPAPDSGYVCSLLSTFSFCLTFISDLFIYWRARFFGVSSSCSCSNMYGVCVLRASAILAGLKEDMYIYIY